MYVVRAFNREVLADDLKQAKEQAGWAGSMGYAAAIFLDDGTLVEPMMLGCD